MVKCESCKYSSKFTNGLILCDFLKTKICVTANHTCKYGKPEEKMKNLINGQPEQDIEHCATCIHAADSEDICILRKCKYAIAELKDCYEPEQRWIPCSEKEAEYPCLACDVFGQIFITNNGIVRINGECYDGTGFDFSNAEEFLKGIKVGNSMRMLPRKIVAWSPLPEPYKGGEDE